MDVSLLLITLTLILAPTFILSFALLAHRVVDRSKLLRFVRSQGKLSPDRRSIFTLANSIRELPMKADPVFVCKLFEPIGAAPGEISIEGGCCSGKARLLIASLAELRVMSRQITLYHKDGDARHCLVEAFMNDEALIVDPTYGVFFEDAEGRAVSLRNLQEGVVPAARPISNSGPSGYPNKSYFDFDFRATKTANWTLSRPRRAAYQILHILSDGSIDRLAVPPWLEWPQNILAASIASFVAVLLIGAVLLLMQS